MTRGGEKGRVNAGWTRGEREPRTQRMHGRPRYGCRDKNSPVWPRCSLSFHVPVSILRTHTHARTHTHIQTFLCNVSHTLYYTYVDENKIQICTKTETHVIYSDTVQSHLNRGSGHFRLQPTLIIHCSLLHASDDDLSKPFSAAANVMSLLSRIFAWELIYTETQRFTLCIDMQLYIRRHDLELIGLPWVLSQSCRMRFRTAHSI